MNVKRQISVYTIRGGKVAKLTTSVDTWDKLKILLMKKERISTKGLLACDDVTNYYYDNNKTILPKGNFNLFLRPNQIKKIKR